MQWFLGAAILLMGLSFMVNGTLRGSSQMRSSGAVITIAAAVIIALELLARR